MESEKYILTDINEMVYKFLLNLYITKTHILEIKKDILNMENNFFLEEKDNIYGQLLTIFDDDAMNDLIHTITLFKQTVVEKIENICQHEWVEDEIDVSLDRSQKICYCKLCEISKKNE